MMKRSILFFCLLLMPLVLLHAQRRIMLFDPEINEPVRGFHVWADNHRTDSTNIFGEVSIPERFDTLLLTKPGYVALRIPAKWVEDSIPVIRDYNHIGEVVVYGQRADRVEEAARNWTKEDKVEAQLQHPITGIGFNLNEVFDKRRRRDKKRAKQLEKVFRQMDDDDSPYIQSYRRELNKQR